MSTNATPAPESAPQLRPDLWWHTAVVYQLYVPSFSDANGDGWGDLLGIRRRLDHLENLGIDAIWLSPCYPSPQHDHGYDVADYFDINPKYGDLAEFDTLVAEAKSRGIRILMDIVPNHCSFEHEWFKAAVAAGPGSPERERFYFRDGRGEHGELAPNNWRSVFGGTTWTRITEADGTPGQWYLHTFSPQQPDFNWSNPDVVDHFDRALTFWFDRGVEGFRVDAVTVAGKAPGLPDAPPVPEGVAENDVWSHNPYSVFLPESHGYWKHWRDVIDAYEATHPGRNLVTVSEAYTAGRPEQLAQYVTGEFHQSFAFELMLAPWRPETIRAVVAETITTMNELGVPPAWTINNHDTQRVVTRLGRANATELASYTGNNLVYVDAPVDLELGTLRARAAIMFAAALPGTLYIYQGEELGLEEVLDLPNEVRQDPIFFRTEGRQIGRDGCRVPMPWTLSPENSFGFSDTGVASWLPQPNSWGHLAADEQARNDGSMLAFYRSVLKVRKRLDGPLAWTETNHDQLVTFSRGDVLVVLNPTAEPVAIDSKLLGALGVREIILASSNDPFNLSPGVVPANTCMWWAVES
jgi:alpha-glucosidase